MLERKIMRKSAWPVKSFFWQSSDPDSVDVNDELKHNLFLLTARFYISILILTSEEFTPDVEIKKKKIQ